jgi:hypothetical protein
MPNHTTNQLEVIGNAHEVARFIEENKIQDEDSYEGVKQFSFEAQMPTPPETKVRENVVRLKECATDDLNKIVFPSWYTWRVDNWGTKWDCYDVEDWVDNKIRYFTAWSPASNFFLHVSAQYPNLTFHHQFSDEGGLFIGEQTIVEGKIEEEFWYDWDSQEAKALRVDLDVPEWDEED